MYCVEWSRQEYNGGPYAWALPKHHEINEHLGNTEIAKLTRNGLRWWERKARFSDGREFRLHSLVLEGGCWNRASMAASRHICAGYWHG
jgi:hypothetical protein